MKQCREHNCPLQDICRGAVDNETWWNISDDCEIFAFVKKQDDTIFALENRLKECENGYEGTLHLESCKLHDAEEKVKELTQANDMISESYDHLEKTKDNLLAERARLTEENERLRGENKALVNENAELKTQIQEEISEEDIDLFDEFTKLLTEGIKEAKANNASEFKTRFAVHFGTYTDKDMTPIIEVFRLLDQIAKEMLEGENES